jgi:hypothetical protein
MLSTCLIRCAAPGLWGRQTKPQGASRLYHNFLFKSHNPEPTEISEPMRACTRSQTRSGVASFVMINGLRMRIKTGINCARFCCVSSASKFPMLAARLSARGRNSGESSPLAFTSQLGSGATLEATEIHFLGGVSSSASIIYDL